MFRDFTLITGQIVTLISVCIKSYLLSRWKRRCDRPKALLRPSWLFLLNLTFLSREIRKITKIKIPCKLVCTDLCEVTWTENDNEKIYNLIKKKVWNYRNYLHKNTIWSFNLTRSKQKLILAILAELLNKTCSC